MTLIHFVQVRCIRKICCSNAHIKSTQYGNARFIAHSLYFILLKDDSYRLLFPALRYDLSTDSRLGDFMIRSYGKKRMMEFMGSMHLTRLEFLSILV